MFVKDPGTTFQIYGYPKVGNTWIQVMLAYVMNSKSMKAGYAVPRKDIFLHGIPNFNIVTYNEMQVSVTSNIKQMDVVLLIRHPGDTLVSLYMHNRYREQYTLYDNSIDAMVYDPVYGIEKFLEYYKKWAQHRLKIPKSFYLVRYEDLKQDTHAVFVSMLKAIGIEASVSLIKEAVAFGSFKNMQKLEKSNHLKFWNSLKRPIFVHKNAFKVRKGKVGNYRSLFSKQTVAYIEKRTEELPEFYGYRQTT